MIAVAKKKKCVEEKYVPMGTSSVQIVFMVASLDQHAHTVHYAESP